MIALIAIGAVAAYMIGLGVTAGRLAHAIGSDTSTSELHGLGGLWILLALAWPLIAFCLIVGCIAKWARGADHAA